MSAKRHRSQQIDPADPVSADRGRGYLFVRWLILVLIVFLGSEVLATLGIRIINPRLEAPLLRTSEIYREQSEKILELIESHNGSGRTMFDGRLGYRYRAGYRAANDAINAQGLRSYEEYSRMPAEGVLRVAAFGDSFVYSTETDNDDSWTRLMETTFPNLEVLNYGVGAYGMTQAYVRFLQEGTDLSPDVVIIGFAPVMLGRTVSVYRRFLAANANPLVKPRFLLDDDGLMLVASPLDDLADYQRYLSEPWRVIELATHDQWYRPSVYKNPLYDLSATVRLATGLWIRADNRVFNANRLLRSGVFNTSSEAFRVQIAIIQKFANEVARSGMTPIVVMLPAFTDVVGGFSGRAVSYMPLVERLEDSGIEYIDLMEAFREHSETNVEDWFMSGRHYSPAANRIAAERIGSILQERTR